VSDIVSRDAARIAYGRDLQRWRTSQGLTQVALAARIGWSVVSLRKWEQGIALPCEKAQADIAAARLANDAGSACS
jgi:transcriptional regulator with XRE-family HTH domain